MTTSDTAMTGCCGCFGFLRKPHQSLMSLRGGGSRHPLLPSTARQDHHHDNINNNNNSPSSSSSSYHFSSYHSHSSSLNRFDSPTHKITEQILLARSGVVCRQVPVKETPTLHRSQDENGNKMVNQYVRKCKIGSGSYGKVVLYQSTIDGKNYAIKVFHKSHLLKLRVAPSQTAMADVLREVAIMKMLDHPNIVNLIEVIDDPNMDQFYMVMEYVEGKWVCDGAGNGLEESISRRYLRDIVAGLMYLHSHNVVHGDIKPDNLLITSAGRVKIGDFSVSQVFEDDNDELRRSPGTPVFTAPECCLGLTYHGRAADTWAVGVTLYCMVFGRYPFLGDSLQDTYDKIVSNPLIIPADMDSQLKDLLEGLLCKDPLKRLILIAVSDHPWVVRDAGPIPGYLCRCKCSCNSSS